MIHQEAGEHGCDDLCGHGCGVIVAGVLTNVAAGTHLHHHGEGVDVDGSPADTSQNEQHIHQQSGAGGTHESSRSEGSTQHHNTTHDGLFATDFRGNHTSRQISDDGSGLSQQHGGVVVFVQNFGGVDTVFGSDSIVAEVPQSNGQQDKNQRTLFSTGETALGGSISCFFLNAKTNALITHFGRPFLFPYGQQEDDQCGEHDAGNNTVINGVAHHGILHCGSREHDAKHQHQNTTGGTHQIDDGIGLGTQGFDGDVGHQSHSRGAEGGHGHQHHQQEHHEQNQFCGVFGSFLSHISLPGGGNIVGVIGIGDLFAGFGIGDLAANCGEIVLSELVLQNKFLPLRSLQLSLVLGIVNYGQGGRIVNGSNIGDVLQLGIIHEGQSHQCKSSNNGADGDEGGALAVFIAQTLVGQSAEQR